MLNLHVVFAIDRAGLVGEDGETHHGVFDVGFLRQTPNMQVLTPGSLAELQDMMRWAVLKCDGPVAVRYPRGGDKGYIQSAWEADGSRLVTSHRQGKNATIVTYGTLLQNAMDAAALLADKGIETTVLRLLKVNPLPVQQIYDSLSQSHRVFVLEEVCTGSGIGQELAWKLSKLDGRCKTDCIDLGRNFVTHGSVDALHKALGLDGAAVAKTIEEALKNEN